MKPHDMRLGNGGICTQIGKYSDAMLNTAEKKTM